MNSSPLLHLDDQPETDKLVPVGWRVASASGGEYGRRNRGGPSGAPQDPMRARRGAQIPAPFPHIPTEVIESGLANRERAHRGRAIKIIVVSGNRHLFRRVALHLFPEIVSCSLHRGKLWAPRIPCDLLTLEVGVAEGSSSLPIPTAQLHS